MKLKVHRQAGQIVQRLKMHARQTISSRARAHCPAHAPTVRRARSLGPAHPRSCATHTRTSATHTRTSFLVARKAHARGPERWCFLPYPRMSSALCSRLRTSRNTRVSAAATAMADSGTHAGPSQQLPEAEQGGARAAEAGGWLPGRGSAAARRDPAAAVWRLERHLPGRERTAEAPDLPQWRSSRTGGT